MHRRKRLSLVSQRRTFSLSRITSTVVSSPRLLQQAASDILGGWYSSSSRHVPLPAVQPSPAYIKGRRPSFWPLCGNSRQNHRYVPPVQLCERSTPSSAAILRTISGGFTSWPGLSLGFSRIRSAKNRLSHKPSSAGPTLPTPISIRGGLFVGAHSQSPTLVHDPQHSSNVDLTVDGSRTQRRKESWLLIKTRSSL